MKLKDKHCKPCEGGVDKLTALEINRLMSSVHADWLVVDKVRIQRDFRFVNFKQTMEFVNKVAILAESQGHHPDMLVSYASCQIKLWTHAINGLSENDFILASKIDEI